MGEKLLLTKEARSTKFPHILYNPVSSVFSHRSSLSLQAGIDFEVTGGSYHFLLGLLCLGLFPL